MQVFWGVKFPLKGHLYGVLSMYFSVILDLGCQCSALIGNLLADEISACRRLMAERFRYCSAEKRDPLRDGVWFELGRSCSRAYINIDTVHVHLGILNAV